jgi:hypothetical protein
METRRLNSRGAPHTRDFLRSVSRVPATVEGMILAYLLMYENLAMKTRQTAGIFLLILLVFSCDDEDKTFTSIVGKWIGTTARIQLKPFGLPIPISKKDDSFAAEIEFRTDGTVTLVNDSETHEGTYQVVDDKIITDLRFATEVIDLSGTYTIETLTASTLVFYIKKNDTITDPDTGKSITGDIKATLEFERL